MHWCQQRVRRAPCSCCMLNLLLAYACWAPPPPHCHDQGPQRRVCQHDDTILALPVQPRSLTYLACAYP